MNKRSRKRLDAACDHIINASYEISSAINEEEYSLLSIPENMQGSKRYENIEQSISDMTDIIFELSDIEEKVRKI